MDGLIGPLYPVNSVYKYFNFANIFCSISRQSRLFVKNKFENICKNEGLNIVSVGKSLVMSLYLWW